MRWTWFHSTSDHRLSPLKCPDYIKVNQVNTIWISISAFDERDTRLLLESNAVTLSLWDWQQNAWVMQPLGAANAAGMFQLTVVNKEAQRYFDVQNSNLQLQLTAPGNSYQQFLLPVRIEGIW